MYMVNSLVTFFMATENVEALGMHSSTWVTRDIMLDRNVSRELQDSSKPIRRMT